MKHIFSFVILLTLLLLPVAVFAVHSPLNLNLTYPKFGPFDLSENQHMNEIVGFLYYFIITIAGLAAFVMLVWGGIQWLTSGAIPSQASEARDKLRNAILGLLLILASVLIIQIINPELTVLQLPEFNKGLGGEVPTLPDGPAPPSSSVVLTADGQPDLLCIPGVSSATVMLGWTATGVSGCTADSAPDATLWTGSKTDTGSEPITIPTTGTQTFLLSCAALSNKVKVTVTTGSCTGTPITVDLKGRDNGAPVGSGVDAPLPSPLISPDDFPSGDLALDWTSSPGTASCDTDGGPFNHFFAVGRPPNGTQNNLTVTGLPVFGPFIYTINCIDATGTQTASDTVHLEIK